MSTEDEDESSLSSSSTDDPSHSDRTPEELDDPLSLPLLFNINDDEDGEGGDGDDLHHHNGEDDDDDQYAQLVRKWAQRVPIGLGFCPWAVKSQRQGLVRYVTCPAKNLSGVLEHVLVEANVLCQPQVTALSTTLVVCPHLVAWKNDFNAFDEFVRNLFRNHHDHSCNGDYAQEVTFVAFHPHFLRWRGLPEEITAGIVVQSHRRFGFQKSQEPSIATVTETNSALFGQRRVKVRFHDDNKEQHIPTDWVVRQQGTSNNEIGFERDEDSLLGPPLPDNAMHRAPYPTIHLIRNQDLGGLQAREVSRVKRKNAQRMMKLGWKVVEGCTMGA